MARKPIYLDYNATTPVHPEVVKIMNQYYLNDFGNAGSVHDFGLNAHNALDDCKHQVKYCSLSYKTLKEEVGGREE